MIDFEWYRSFISIYKHRSVSAAAQARILTQPAMSQHLAALEAEVGEPLFIRAPRKMIPTDKGKELYTKLVPLIENLESMSMEIRHMSVIKSEPIVRLGSAVEYFTQNALGNLKELEIRLSVQFGTTAQLLEELQRDHIDLFIATQKLQIPGIEYTKIDVETFVVTAPPDYSTDALENNEIEQWLSGQKWLSYGLELPIIRRYWRANFGDRPFIEPFHVIPDLRAILSAIEHGMGVSILPLYLIQESVKQKKTNLLFPHLSVKNTLYAAYKVEKRDNPAIQQIIENLKKGLTD
ncbi:LysR family transcriptional regulator [Heyndrickxia acidicola]|uniref:LysR family transcriptional regulator n=1 Tax=Heyndrickxia acidicola TaxID=209389 RepID=A0ABU6MRY7_9BACI|nr:LysR family transcriptional regulator [Heyndrickxia acidicola]MED1205800.1 LysR family transcriptional regulator [Heyndrickxia acidicola]